jgi:HAD superfamily hydrolase (TIGR01509 family)
MSGCRAVIFDLDGVIVNSEPLHERAFFDVLHELGYGQNHGIRFADYVGRSDFELWEDFVERHQPPQPLAELMARKRNRVIDIVRRSEPIFDGLPELVAGLAARFPLAVASGSERPFIEAVLALRNLQRFFRVVVSAGEVPRGKPAPDIFLRAAQSLGVAPAGCVVIEDSKPGVAAGLAAGMRVIAITNTHPAAELQDAHHVVQSYAEIERLLAAPP